MADLPCFSHTSFLTGLPFLPLILCGVLCYQIGLGSYGAPGQTQMQPQLNPFIAGQGFDIIPSDTCYLRFQVPQTQGNDIMAFKQAGIAARVTTATWTTTPEDVIETCNNLMGGTTNSALWLTQSYKAYQYTGLLKTRYLGMQMSLYNPNTVVSYLLPSGVHKVREVSAGSNPNSNCQEFEKVGGAGIQGTVDLSEDYAYARMFDVALGLSKRYPPNDLRIFNPNVLGPGQPWSAIAGPFVPAEKADGSCVVIDFRDLPLWACEY